MVTIQQETRLSVDILELRFIVENGRITTTEEFKTEDYIFRLQIKYLWSTRDYMSQES